MMKQIFGRSPVTRTLKGHKKQFKIVGVRVNRSLLNSQLAMLVIMNNIIRPVARKGYGSIAHEAKPNRLLIRGP